MKPTRAAIYTRVSLNSQDTTAQREELTQYVQRRGWEPRYYTDEGQSGAKESRPGLYAMLRDVRQRKIDVVVIWALDRLARSLKQLLNLLEELRQLGVDFVSYKQQLDTSSPAGRLMYQVLGAFAEFERELLRQRVTSGMQNAKRRGRRIGRPPLHEFTSAEKAEICLAHKNEQKSVRRLAIEHKTTQWMIAQILSRGSAPSQKGILLGREKCQDEHQ
jgi:DNA invertase Pin-like site-specific DNA recombinase